MANCCFYEMRITAKKDNLNKFIEEYTNFYKLGRLYSTEIYNIQYNEDDTAYFEMSGDCAWSIFCAFRIEDDDCEILRISKEYNLIIEMYSDELGFEFQEHYIIKNGIVELDESYDYIEICKSEFDNVEDINYVYNTSFTERQFLDDEEYLYVTNYPDGYIMNNFTIKDFCEAA